MRALYLLPVLIFAGIAGAFGAYLALGIQPQELPSSLIDRPAPSFALPDLPGRLPAKPTGGLSTADLEKDGPLLVNFYASWCVPCRAEHPMITRLAEQEGITIHAVSYKDRPEASAAWLRELGDPFSRIGLDLNGRAGIDWGITGVPETFIIDREGRVRLRHQGPITREVLEEKIRPVLK
jgi:cytochrome c biogenesis protein CcmG/thiol:disulfide interchange protein DsbE